ncbi:hypothetical protein C8034_v004082 [Colletotrichum sidae]|uniref:NPP1 domain-containing protein n=1 Tax=Colletotrichum sidae TaxID=1347389 RepID=A0A4R8T8V5_9PEZI|nr:hypothetical protein C8034_v004082 [Colletotrichum sidae]
MLRSSISSSLLFLGLATLSSGLALSPRKGDGDVAIAPGFINHDAVVPFQQQASDGVEGEIEIHFKPWLNDGAGCFPYAAVDRSGFHGAGLRPVGKSSGDCRDPSKGQTYARVGTSNGRTGVLYSWYIPKIQNDEKHKHYYLSIVVWLHTDICKAKATDYKVVGISYSTGKESWDKFSSPNTLYTASDANFGPVNTHAIVGYWGKMNVEPSRDSAHYALSPPMIAWSKLAKPAEDQLNDIAYEHARCPFNDNNFQATLDAAFNGDLYNNLPLEPTLECVPIDPKDPISDDPIPDDPPKKEEPKPEEPKKEEPKKEEPKPEEPTPVDPEDPTEPEGPVPVTSDPADGLFEDGPEIPEEALPADPTFTPTP